MAAAHSGGAVAQSTPAPPDAQAYIIWPPDGQVIQGGRLWVRMGLKNMGVAPSGVSTPNTGHHHLLVDADPPQPGEPIPNDRNHLHFGAGETEARLTDLPPGEYTLQMLLGDAAHYPHNPPIASEKIRITVAPY
ncbi:MAG: DUF4399 domain-containing protein [Geminicoccales bacterium]